MIAPKTGLPCRPALVRNRFPVSRWSVRDALFESALGPSNAFVDERRGTRAVPHRSGAGSIGASSRMQCIKPGTARTPSSVKKKQMPVFLPISPPAYFAPPARPRAGIDIAARFGDPAPHHFLKTPPPQLAATIHRVVIIFRGSRHKREIQPRSGSPCYLCKSVCSDVVS